MRNALGPPRGPGPQPLTGNSPWAWHLESRCHLWRRWPVLRAKYLRGAFSKALLTEPSQAIRCHTCRHLFDWAQDRWQEALWTPLRARRGHHSACAPKPVLGAHFSKPMRRSIYNIIHNSDRHGEPSPSGDLVRGLTRVSAFGFDSSQEAGATVPIFQQTKWRLREAERPAQGHRASDGRPVEAPAAWDRPYQEPGAGQTGGRQGPT